MNDRERRLLIAGMLARQRWATNPMTTQIFEIDRNFTVAVPVMVNSSDPPLPWKPKGPEWAQETISLEEFTDQNKTSIWLGYGPRSNTLAVWDPLVE